MPPRSATREGPSIEALLYHAHKEGVLPITSVCNMGCVFCSNRYSPASCEAFDIGTRSLQEIVETIPWLQNAPGAITIGESVTRVNEGEPLTHPDFLEIVARVREAYPKRPVKVTTNGSLLYPEVSRRLGELGIELMVSLNTVSKRQEIMGDSNPDATLENILALKDTVRFDGSIVALPFLSGWDDIEETCRFLKEAGALTIRLLAPGFSSLHPLSSRMTSATWPELRRFAVTVMERLGIPVLFEPPELRDMVARVEAVLDESPASAVGMKRGDVITKVAGAEVWSRQDAFGLAKERENPRLTLLRDGAEIQVALAKPRRTSPGFVVYEDLDSRKFAEWTFRAGFGRPTPPLILTSSLARPLIQSALESRGLAGRVVQVRSRYFGGNIQAAGLLTVNDFLSAFRNFAKSETPPGTVTLPARAFDPWGRDLEGVSHKLFTEETGCQVVLAG